MQAVLEALPGYAALVTEKGETLAASARWNAEVGGLDRLATPGGAPLLDALRQGEAEGQTSVPTLDGAFAARWKARPYLNGDGRAWVVGIEGMPERDGRFRGLFNTMFEFMGLMTPDGTLLEANEAALRFGGLARADVVGRKIWEAYWFGVSPALQDEIRADVARAAGGQFVRREVVVWGAGEAPTPIDFSILPIRNAQGEVTHLIPEGRDISDLHQTREKLRAESAVAARYNTYLRRLYHISTTAYPTLDALLRDVLEIGCEVLGLPVGAVNTFRGESCRYQAVVPAGAPIHAGQEVPSAHTLCHYVWQRRATVALPDLDAAPDTHTHFAYREQGVRAYLGVPLYVDDELYGALFFAGLEAHAPFEAPEVELVEMMARRLERALERARADASLAEARQLLIHAQRMAGVGSWRWNATTGTIEWSDEVYRIFGLPPGSAVGMDAYQRRLHPDDRADLQALIARALEKGEGYSVQHRVVWPDEQVRHVHSIAEVRRDEAGHVLLTGTVQDVTDRVLAEQALARTNQALEQRNRELQDFAYVASHDLQEPLRKIRAFADLLQRDYAPRLEGDGLHYLGRIDHAAERMARLISDLLTFSRVATRVQPFSRVALQTVAEEVLFDLEIALKEAGGRVELHDLPPLEADPMQMRQLLQNLIGNAIKFRDPDRPVRVDVRGRVRPGPDGPAVLIEVEDNGIGFDEKYLDRIFTPFQRLHAQHEYAGTGMGLAICRRIVERHQGQITARSQPGAGTTFIVTLPCQASPSAELSIHP